METITPSGGYMGSTMRVVTLSPNLKPPTNKVAGGTVVLPGIGGYYAASWGQGLRGLRD